MTQEENNLLFRDLCARLPYGVKVTFAGYSGREDCALNAGHLNSTYCIEYLRLRPYLRPMSSMTEDEKIEWDAEYAYNSKSYKYEEYLSKMIDWLNTRHFDYRGLIDKGLALEAPEGMYKEG